MISKERLEELIEQGNAYIYDKYRAYSLRNREEKTGDFYWKRQVEVVDDCLHYVYEDGDNCENFDSYIKLEDLYETKEETEWHKEFGCIERTERLELPTWEEICDGATHNIPFTTPKVQKVEMIICDEYIDIVSIYQSIIDFSKPLTKENYTLACRKAKELFLGE